jgi:hypothetical protein
MESSAPPPTDVSPMAVPSNLRVAGAETDHMTVHMRTSLRLRPIRCTREKSWSRSQLPFPPHHLPSSPPPSTCVSARCKARTIRPKRPARGGRGSSERAHRAQRLGLSSTPSMRPPSRHTSDPRVAIVCCERVRRQTQGRGRPVSDQTPRHPRSVYDSRNPRRSRAVSSEASSGRK